MGRIRIRNRIPTFDTASVTGNKWINNVEKKLSNLLPMIFNIDYRIS